MIESAKIKNFDDEPKRKVLHDKYLESKGINSSQTFIWGNIISEFDNKSCISSIIISYD